jgi:hypothetical protein
MKKLVIGIVLTLILITSAMPLVAASAQAEKPLDNVIISPTTATVPVGGTKQFTALGRDADNVTVANVSYSWAVIAGGGTISNTGLFTAGSTTGIYTNTVQVTAVKGTIVKTAYATVNVTAPGPLDNVIISPTTATVPVGGTKQFTAMGRDADNVTVANVSYSWAVIAGGGTISNTGLFTAGSTVGTYTNTIQVTAVKGTIVKTAYATVNVTAPGPLDNVIISPTTATVPVGGTKQFTALGRDADNVTVANVSYSWAVIASGGTISNTGLFTAGSTVGTYTNTIQVTAVKGTIVKTAYATVKVTTVEKKECRWPYGWSRGKKTGWYNFMPPGWLHGRKIGWYYKGIHPARFRMMACWPR